jgi:hypothetical protein
MSSSNVSYHKGKARKAAAWDAAETKAGVSFARISASARTHEGRAQQIEQFRGLSTQLQNKTIADATAQARSALGTVDFAPGEALAWSGLVGACGMEEALRFLAHLRKKHPRRELEQRMREKRGAKIQRAAAPSKPLVTVEEALRGGLLKSSGILCLTAPASAAAAVEDVEELEVAPEPWPMTPWTAFAIQMSYTSEEARLAGDPECEVQRVSVVAAAWRVLFGNLRQWFKARCIQGRDRAAVRCVNAWDEQAREDKYFTDRFFLRLPRYQYDDHDEQSWSRLDSVKVEADQAVERYIAWDLRVSGVSAVLLASLKRSRAKLAAAAAAKKGQGKRKRLTTAERDAHHAAAIKKLAMPGYLVPKALDTFTKPIEQISSVRLGNLRLAVGQAQLRTLNKDVRDFVAFHGGRVAEGPGGVFIPFRGQSQGYCFVKLVSHENARALLERLVDEPTMLDRETNVERPVFAELAASERKSKAEMEAEKAKAGEARRLAALSKPLTEREKIVAAMNAKMAAPTTELKQVALKPVCLGATRKAAEEAAKAAEAAKLKATVAAMFACALPSKVATTSAPTFELSFSGAAAKPKPVLTKLVDATHISVGGVVKQFVASPLTELGKAQEALRELTAQEEKEEARKAQKARRAARAKRNAAAKAKCAAEGREFDVSWEGEVDSEDEAEPVVVLSARCVATPVRLPVQVIDADACAAARELMLAAFKPTVKEEAVLVLATAEPEAPYDCSRYTALTCTDGTPISHGPIFRAPATEMSYAAAEAEADRLWKLMGN